MWTLFKEVKTTGCVMEDGADTRETTTELVLVKEEELENYHESCASEYGYQDYSYQFNSKKLGEFYTEELEDLRDKINAELGCKCLDCDESRKFLKEHEELLKEPTGADDPDGTIDNGGIEDGGDQEMP